MPDHNDSDPLDPLLDRLGRQTPLPPAPIGPEVWRRISLAEESARGGFWERFHAVFARPSFAVTFVAACVFLGLFLAEVRRSQRRDDYNRELMQSYLRLIDPLLQASDRPSLAKTATKS
jgi:hypothetical protein